MKVYLLIIVFVISPFLKCTANDFPLVIGSEIVSILYDVNGPRLDSITAHLLAGDIERVTTFRPLVLTDMSQVRGRVIVIGNILSDPVRKLLGKRTSFHKDLAGKWECYGFKVIAKPTKNITQALVIAGSDDRGTAYGVFALSEKIGVSPWYWWADIPVMQKKELSVNQPDFISSPPSVRYRGIFINDEDWGLQPWAAKTFEPETGDIGPKTYAKVFELLLRLKANLIWPAMHPSTKPFYYYPGNKKVASNYAIVIGSSHAEPMLRNNVGEWDSKNMGEFNYLTNKDTVYRYWEKRIRETSNDDVIYTLGMRGIHDSGMQGVKDSRAAVTLLERIISNQRDLLQKYNPETVTTIPQVFTAYKEVLDIYDNNLKLPDDVTLVWPDDNYGYIQRLNSEKEQNRSGGSGVYYHASYWGRPHDYLWLSSTHPGLIREEMIKAYHTGSARLWILNVGDIKPLEYNIQMFMDMAFDVTPFKDSRYPKKHLNNWVAQVFDNTRPDSITDVLWDYYQLAFERRPEFMGWSQTEPTTPTRHTAYNHFYFGDEAKVRIDRYTDLQKRVNDLRAAMKAGHADAFYQLVYYPVTGAALMNKKFLYSDKAYHYGKQNRHSALDYVTMAKQAYDSIVDATAYYNDQMSNGKWKHIMSMNPRRLPVYHEPTAPKIEIDKSLGWDITPEGFTSRDSIAKDAGLSLPRFSRVGPEHYFIDVFLCGDDNINWQATVSERWIKLSETGGVLKADYGENQVRVWASIDWSMIGDEENLSGEITFSDGKKRITVSVSVFNANIPELKSFKGFVEHNGLISMYASHYSKERVGKSLNWEVMHDFGHTGEMLVATPPETSSTNVFYDSAFLKESSAYVEYDFYSFTECTPEISVFTLPTHPVNKRYSMRYAVSIDDGPVTILDFKTFGRSEEWKQNVLRNNAIKTFTPGHLPTGKHTLTIYAIDPAVTLDRIVINLENKHSAYSVIPETRGQR